MKWQKREAPFPSSSQELRGLQRPTRAAGAEAGEAVVPPWQGAAWMQPLPGGLGQAASAVWCVGPEVWGVSAGLGGAPTRSRGRAVFLQAFPSTAASPAMNVRGRAAGPKSQLVLGREKPFLFCFLTPTSPWGCAPAAPLPAALPLLATGLPCTPFSAEKWGLCC